MLFFGFVPLNPNLAAGVATPICLPSGGFMSSFGTRSGRGGA